MPHSQIAVYRRFEEMCCLLLQNGKWVLDKTASYPIWLQSSLIDLLSSVWIGAITIPMHLGLKNGPLLPHNLIPVQRSHAPSLKFQMALRLKLLMSSGSEKKEPRYACVSEAKASHSPRMWGEVSSSAPHLIHKGLLVSPIKWRCLLRVLWPVRRPLTNLDFRVILIITALIIWLQSTFHLNSIFLSS
jgi:hypothetical protein